MQDPITANLLSLIFFKTSLALLKCQCGTLVENPWSRDMFRKLSILAASLILIIMLTKGWMRHFHLSAGWIDWAIKCDAYMFDKWRMVLFRHNLGIVTQR